MLPASNSVLAEALAAYSVWLGHGHAARALLWVERLGMNAGELARFRDVDTPECSAYIAQPVVPTPPRADTIPPLTPARRDAGAAWTQARELAALHAFTVLPEQIDTPSSGYLHGVPFAVKDLIGVAGLPCSGGSRSSPSAPLSEDAVAVAAMRRQGAVMIGLTNLHELAFGATSANPMFGRVVNPIAPDRIPGGSSGGSAAAVAAGILDVTLGTDTGGSIRIPAACCGVVGFKPSYDAVPRTGVIDVAASLDHVGPIGRSVADCALAFAAMTGLASAPTLPEQPLAGVRVLRLGGFFEVPLEVAVADALDELSVTMERDGASLSHGDLLGVELAPAIQFIVISTEAAAAHGNRLRNAGYLLGEDVRVRLEMAHFLPGHWYLKAQRLRRRLVDNMQALFEHADVLLCPTMRAVAPRVGATDIDIDGTNYPLHTAMSNLTLPFSLSGMPAISIPWGVTSEGVPIGMQLVAAPGQDWRLLQVALRLEKLAPGFP